MSEIDDFIYDAIDAAQELAETLQNPATTLDDALVWIDDTAYELKKIVIGMKGLEYERGR